MSNGTYQTEGIVLNSLDQGEADKLITVYTKEFGMMRLFARGTRRPSSKLNKFLNIFSYARFGFVSGKDSWHLIDAEDLEYFDEVFKNREKLFILGKALRFIERLHHGEGRDEDVFCLIKNTMDFLKAAPPELFPEFELIFYAKALALLGYLDPSSLGENLENLIGDNSFADKLLILDEEEKKTIDKAVREGIASSQL
ncbi:DNA repair protein RecO [Candidatus Giovannonibacteria bacterium RIFCSPLOWO2_01_FULL_46_13]|uniref:DNA repair protein RecO n=1 Tax=Candidatus Giovannonibacteria bacterium RIFCSPLOWO2_01_FULL_46_13 TaxID=1798352 RepID=A0A1F5X3W5_9BACT|nr:MAG: DNA repair protein RecO [Candidatus Giovannonibacteria bacterium RIFCSPLOWO2_01_FULL_46_13]